MASALDGRNSFPVAPEVTAPSTFTPVHCADQEGRRHSECMAFFHAVRRYAERISVEIEIGHMAGALCH